VADLVLEAFGHALGQGTMNNLTLGNDQFTYYETLGGGQGACADADGPSAVHVAMSNTLNTPVEALELEFPLRAVEYALRRGSGGAGRRRGGDGVVRELEALAEMRYSLITERRRHAPPAPTVASRAPGVGTYSTARRSPPRRPERCTPATDFESRHQEVVDMAGLERVAFVGLGIMGGPMARNLGEAGFELSVYTRTRENAERFAAEHRARAAATPAEAAEGADAFITMVPDAPQVEEVLFGDHGAAAVLSDGALVVDMSTTSPTASRAIAERLSRATSSRRQSRARSPRPRTAR